MAWHFPIWYYFSVDLSKLMCISDFVPSLSPSNYFVILDIYSAFLFCSLGCHISTQTFFGFSCNLLLLCFRFISPHLLVELPFFLLECSSLYCFALCWYLFNLLSFTGNFRFISSNCIEFSLCCLFPLSVHVPVSFLCFIILVCFCRFFISVSSRFSLSDFDLLFVLFEEIPISTQTNFAPA